MEHKYDVFISYSRKDYVDENENVLPDSPVNAILNFLDENKISYWFDKKGLYKGAEFVEVISDAIVESKMMIFLSTTNSNESIYTAGEIFEAIENNKLIIPIKVDDSKYNKKFRLLVNPLDYVDYKKADALSDLLKTIECEKAKIAEQERETAKKAEELKKREWRKAVKIEILDQAEELNKLKETRKALLDSIYKKMRTIDITQKQCPICGAKTEIEAEYCKICGWFFPALSNIEGIGVEADKSAIILARSRWESKSSFDGKNGHSLKLENVNKIFNCLKKYKKRYWLHIISDDKHPTPKPNYTKYILGALVVALGVIVGIWLPTPPEPTAEDVVADIIYEEPTASVEPVTIDSAAISQQAVAEYKKQEEQRLKEETERKQREDQARLAEEKRKQEEAAIRNGNTFTVKGVSFTMIAVKGGSYTMGCTSEQGSNCYRDEKPAHSEYVSDFMIGETEVTQALWQAVMGNNPSYFTGDMQRPVENVSWDDCQTFIRKLNQLTGENFRLPNEAEWEYAARGGNKSRGYKYSGNNNVGTVAWYDGNSGKTTHRVKTKQPNELGIYDMSGNVLEWCQDKHSSDYNSPRNSGLRVLRGGGWHHDARIVRVSYRSGSNPGLRDNCGGLRLAF